MIDRTKRAQKPVYHIVETAEPVELCIPLPIMGPLRGLLKPAFCPRALQWPGTPAPEPTAPAAPKYLPIPWLASARLQTALEANSTLGPVIGAQAWPKHQSGHPSKRNAAASREDGCGTPLPHLPPLRLCLRAALETAITTLETTRIDPRLALIDTGPRLASVIERVEAG